MNVIKCNKGHYYDSEKYKNCPHCLNMKDITKVINSKNPTEDNVTMLINSDTINPVTPDDKIISRLLDEEKQS